MNTKKIAILAGVIILIISGIAFFTTRHSQSSKKITIVPTVNISGTLRLILGVSPQKKVWVKDLSRSTVPNASLCDTLVKGDYIIIQTTTMQGGVLYSCKKALTESMHSIPLVDKNKNIVGQQEPEQSVVSEIVVFIPNDQDASTLRVVDAQNKVILEEKEFTKNIK